MKMSKVFTDWASQVEMPGGLKLDHRNFKFLQNVILEVMKDLPSEEQDKIFNLALDRKFDIKMFAATLATTRNLNTNSIFEAMRKLEAASEPDEESVVVLPPSAPMTAKLPPAQPKIVIESGDAKEAVGPDENVGETPAKLPSDQSLIVIEGGGDEDEDKSKTPPPPNVLKSLAGSDGSAHADASTIVLPHGPSGDDKSVQGTEKPKRGVAKLLSNVIGKVFPRKSNAKSSGGNFKTSPSTGAKKPISKTVIWGGVIVLVLVLLFVGFSYYKNNGDFKVPSSTPGGVSEPVVPDEVLTSMTPEEKENWANSRLNNTVTESFLTKPSSFADFFNNFKSYLNWLLYTSAILLITLSIIRERTQAAEFSDIQQYLVGVFAAVFFVTTSHTFGVVFFNAGWSTSPLVFQYVMLTVGLLIDLSMQYSAYNSGNKDFSVIAAGLYIYGLLLKWWFPDDVLLSSIGAGLMVLGLVVQYFEINRHTTRDSNAVKKVVISAVLMLVIFSASYIWMYSLLESQIVSFVIPADLVAQEAAAVKLNMLVKGQIASSVTVGLVFSYVFGLIYGMIFLPTRGRDGTVDTRNALILDGDAATLFFMPLFLFLPWIWILPKYWILLFG